MKKILTALSFIALTLFSACEGPEGPPGPQGPPGNATGDNSFLFEFQDIDFVSPEYEVYLTYPDDFVPLNTDVALVYLLWGVEEVNGEPTDIWRPLPQMILTENGWLQYNYDFTKFDVRLFMNADFDMDANLQPIDTDDWIARVVVVPGEDWNSSGGRLVAPDYNTLKEMYNLPDKPVHDDYKLERRPVE